MKLFLLISMAVALMAEGPKPPIVSDKARGNFWKAATIASQADAAKIAADNNKLAAVEAMKKECGDWELQQDPQTLEPICVERKVEARPSEQKSATPSEPKAQPGVSPKEKQ